MCTEYDPKDSVANCYAFKDLSIGDEVINLFFLPF